MPGTSREEAREKACAEKFARRQVGGGAVIMGKVSLLPSTLDTRPGHPVWGCPPPGFDPWMGKILWRRKW